MLFPLPNFRLLCCSLPLPCSQLFPAPLGWLRTPTGMPEHVFRTHRLERSPEFGRHGPGISPEIGTRGEGRGYGASAEGESGPGWAHGQGVKGIGGEGVAGVGGTGRAGSGVGAVERALAKIEKEGAPAKESALAGEGAPAGECGGMMGGGEMRGREMKGRGIRDVGTEERGMGGTGLGGIGMCQTMGGGPFEHGRERAREVAEEGEGVLKGGYGQVKVGAGKAAEGAEGMVTKTGEQGVRLGEGVIETGESMAKLGLSAAERAAETGVGVAKGVAGTGFRVAESAFETGKELGERALEAGKEVGGRVAETAGRWVPGVPFGEQGEERTGEAFERGRETARRVGERVEEGVKGVVGIGVRTAESAGRWVTGVGRPGVSEEEGRGGVSGGKGGVSEMGGAGGVGQEEGAYERGKEALTGGLGQVEGQVRGVAGMGTAGGVAGGENGWGGAGERGEQAEREMRAKERELRQSGRPEMIATEGKDTLPRKAYEAAREGAEITRQQAGEMAGQAGEVAGRVPEKGKELGEKAMEVVQEAGQVGMQQAKEAGLVASQVIRQAYRKWMGAVEEEGEEEEEEGKGVGMGGGGSAGEGGAAMEGVTGTLAAGYRQAKQAAQAGLETGQQLAGGAVQQAKHLAAPVIPGLESSTTYEQRPGVQTRAPAAGGAGPGGAGGAGVGGEGGVVERGGKAYEAGKEYVKRTLGGIAGGTGRGTGAEAGEMTGTGMQVYRQARDVAQAGLESGQQLAGGAVQQAKHFVAPILPGVGGASGTSEGTGVAGVLGQKERERREASAYEAGKERVKSALEGIAGGTRSGTGVGARVAGTGASGTPGRTEGGSEMLGMESGGFAGSIPGAGLVTGVADVARRAVGTTADTARGVAGTVGDTASRTVGATTETARGVVGKMVGMGEEVAGRGYGAVEGTVGGVVQGVKRMTGLGGEGGEVEGEFGREAGEERAREAGKGHGTLGRSVGGVVEGVKQMTGLGGKEGGGMETLEGKEGKEKMEQMEREREEESARERGRKQAYAALHGAEEWVEGTVSRVTGVLTGGLLGGKGHGEKAAGVGAVGGEEMREREGGEGMGEKMRGLVQGGGIGGGMGERMGEGVGGGASAATGEGVRVGEVSGKPVEASKGILGSAVGVVQSVVGGTADVAKHAAESALGATKAVGGAVVGAGGSALGMGRRGVQQGVEGVGSGLEYGRESLEKGYEGAKHLVGLGGTQGEERVGRAGETMGKRMGEGESEGMGVGMGEMMGGRGGRGGVMEEETSAEKGRHAVLGEGGSSGAAGSSGGGSTPSHGARRVRVMVVCYRASGQPTPSMTEADLTEPSIDQPSINQPSMDEPSILDCPSMGESRKLSRRSQSLGSAMSGERTAMAQCPPNAEATVPTGFRHRSLSASSRGFPAIRIVIPAADDDDACDDTRCDDTPCDVTRCDNTPCDDTRCDDTTSDDPRDRACGDGVAPHFPVQAVPFPTPRVNSVEVDRLWEVHVSPSESKTAKETKIWRRERQGEPERREKQKARNADGARAPKQSPLGSASGFARMLLHWAPSSARSSRRKKRGDSAAFGSPAPRSQSVVQSSQSQRVANVSSELNPDTSFRASESGIATASARERAAPFAIRPGAAQAEEPPRGFSARPSTAPSGIFSRWRSAAPLSRPKSPLFGLTYMGGSARRGVSDALPEGNELCNPSDAAASADTDNGAAYNGDRLRSIFAMGTSFSAASERPWSGGGWDAADGAWRTGAGGGWGVADGVGESVSERGDADREDIERRISYSSSIAGAAGSVVSSSTAAYTEVAYSESLIIQHTDRDTDCESVTSASSCSGYDALAWGGSAPMGGGNAPMAGGIAVIGGGNALAGDESALTGGRNAQLGETLADGASGDFATLWRSLPRDLRRTRSLQSPRGYPGGNAGGGFEGESRGNGGHLTAGNSRPAEGENQGSYIRQGSMRRVGSAEMLPAVAHGLFAAAVAGAASEGPLTPSARTPADLPPTSPRSAGGAAWVVSVPSFAQHRLRVASAERAARGEGEGRGGGEGRGEDAHSQDQQQQQQEEQERQVQLQDWERQQERQLLARAHRQTRSLHSGDMEKIRLEHSTVPHPSVPHSQDQQQQQQQLSRMHRRTRSLHSGEMEKIQLEQIGELTIPSFQQHMGEEDSAQRLSRPSPSATLFSPSLHPRLSPRSTRPPPISPRAAVGPPSVLHPTVPLRAVAHPTPPHSQDQQQQRLLPRAHRRTRSLHSGDKEWMRLEQIDEFTIPSFHNHSPSSLRHALPSPSSQLLPPSPSALLRFPSLQSRLRSPRSPRLPPLSPRVPAGRPSLPHSTAQHPTAPHPSAKSRYPKAQSLTSPSPPSSSSIRVSPPQLPHRPPVYFPSGTFGSGPARCTRSSFEAPQKPPVSSPSCNAGHGRSFRSNFELPLPKGGHSLNVFAATACEGREILAVDGRGVFTAFETAKKAAAACGAEAYSEGGKRGRFRSTTLEASLKSSTPRQPFRRCRSLGAGVGDSSFGRSECDYSDASAYSHGQVDSKLCHNSMGNDGGAGTPQDCFSGQTMESFRQDAGVQAGAMRCMVPSMSVSTAALPPPLPLGSAATFPQAVTAPPVADVSEAPYVPVAPVHVAPRDWVEDSYCLLKDGDGVVDPCGHEWSDSNE
ncbi:unnamed protein product [Closterium sp. Yama58-4]|nr:unnamed protein product [Closterium sp. Yama58-4]